jgi:tight adherence protein C
MSASSLAFLAFLAAMTFIVGELCFFAFDISRTRQRLRHRVDLFSLSRWAPAAARGARNRRFSSEPGQLTTLALHGDELEFSRRLEPLHIPASLAPWLYVALRLSVGFLLAITLTLVGYRYFNVAAMPSLIGLGLLGAALGWWMPHFATHRLALHRRRSIARALPEAIELLVIAVEAGLSLEDAVNRIVIELHDSQPAMAAELALTSADLKILPSRDDALRRMAERVDLPSVHSVVATLSQTLKYGTPLAQALRVVAAELRDDALITLEKQANRMPVLLTIPMVLFILPSLFMIIGGPAFLKILDVVMRMR